MQQMKVFYRRHATHLQVQETRVRTGRVKLMEQHNINNFVYIKEERNNANR
jgi:hypothetical protein